MSQLQFITADNVNETLRKDIVDSRRQLADTTYEKEKYNNTNKELRERVKQIETERREQGRTLEESYQKIASRYYILFFTHTHIYRYLMIQYVAAKISVFSIGGCKSDHGRRENAFTSASARSGTRGAAIAATTPLHAGRIAEMSREQFPSSERGEGTAG